MQNAMGMVYRKDQDLSHRYAWIRLCTATYGFATAQKGSSGLEWKAGQSLASQGAPGLWVSRLSIETGCRKIS